MASNPEMPPPDTINRQSPIEMPPDMPLPPLPQPPKIAVAAEPSGVGRIIDDALRAAGLMR